MRAFGFVMAWLLLLPLSSIWYGYVLSVMWAWFVVPAFHVAAISIVFAIGVSMVVRMFTNVPQPSSEEDAKKKSASERLLESSLSSFLYPLFILVLGAIVHAFV